MLYTFNDETDRIARKAKREAVHRLAKLRRERDDLILREQLQLADLAFEAGIDLTGGYANDRV